jgi:hypothetical protein
MSYQLDPEEAVISHASYHKTRCAGWLGATGNRPTRGLLKSSATAKTPQQVRRIATPNPSLGCELHPVEDGDL